MLEELVTMIKPDVILTGKIYQQEKKYAKVDDEYLENLSMNYHCYCYYFDDHLNDL